MHASALRTTAASAAALVVASLLLALGAAAPAPASAMLVGTESNADLVNSNVTTAERAAILDRMRDAGVRVVRINMGWNEVAAGCGAESVDALRSDSAACYDWRAFDEIVGFAQARGIAVLASVSRAPQWLQGSTNPMWLGDTAAQWGRTVQHYAAFAQAAAHRYRSGSPIGRVRMWTVWNEPNSNTYLAPQVTSAQRARVPARYAQLLARTAVAIKASDPTALVAAGPTGPTGGRLGTPPITFVAGVQRNLGRFLPGGSIALKRRWVQAWAHNPYPGTTTAPSAGRTRAPKVGMNNVGDLVRQLDRSPLTRRWPIWATEFSWETNPPDRVFGVAPATQARYLGESLDWLDRQRRVTVAIWYGFRDAAGLSGDWQSGLLYANGTRKPSWSWFQRPISVNAASVRRGSSVRVYARSALRPGAVRIAWSRDGRSWFLLPLAGRRGDGSMVQLVRLTRPTYFAAWDGTRGPARLVRVR